MKLNPIQFNPLQRQKQAASVQQKNETDRGNFASVLGDTLKAESDIRYSAHALERMRDRNIALTEQDTLRIAQSLDEAAAKGSKESLFIMDRLALVMGVPNRTVITVMEPENTKNTVITNIDSVVFVANSNTATQPETKTGLDPFAGSPSIANR